MGVGLGVVSIGVISTIIALAIKGKNSNTNNGNPTKVKNAMNELENKGEIQQKDKKGEFYEKNQKMIKNGITTLDGESQKRYDAIKELILNYKENDLSNYIGKIYDKIDSVNIEDPKKITDKHQEKYIGLLDEFIDIYSGKKKLTEFSAENNNNFGLIVEVQSKDIHYTIYSNEIKVEKVNNNDEVILNMNINVEGFLDLD